MSPGDGSGKSDRPNPGTTGSNSWRTCPAARPSNLDARLFAHPLIGLAGTAIRLPGQRQRHGRKGADRRDGAALQFSGVQFGDTRDEAEMVVIPSLCFTARLPAADVAMLPRLRIQGRRRLALSTKRSSVRRTCR